VQLHEKVALIANGDSELGAAIAGRLLHEGAHVAVHHTGPDVPRHLEGMARPHGPRALPLRADLTSAESVRSMIDAVRKAFGRIDVLVFVALPKAANSMESTSVKEWLHDVDEDLTAFYHCAREISKTMVAQKAGKIIPVFFGVGARGEENVLTWSTTSGGLMGMVKCLAVEFLRYKINVNGVGYGFIEGAGFPLSVRRNLKHYCDLLGVPRVGTLDDVAAAVFFLASPDSDFITGVNLTVTGGLLI
jgi:NAD(P)-dependent dehydrogenase (short-subunit alcohol dehydrogenase family)